MRNKDDPFDPTKLVLLDFDNAGYGFRIWDLLYNIVNWNIDFGKDGESRAIKDIEDFFDGKILVILRKLCNATYFSLY